MSSYRYFLPLTLLGLAVALNLPACSNQSEGQVCNIENGNEDCEEGLTCISKTQLLGTSDICCPATGSTHPACIPDTATGGVSSSSSASSSSGAGGTGGTGGAGGSGGAGGQGGT